MTQTGSQRDSGLKVLSSWKLLCTARTRGVMFSVAFLHRDDVLLSFETVSGRARNELRDRTSELGRSV